MRGLICGGASSTKELFFINGRMNLIHLKEYSPSEKANHVRIGELLSEIPGNCEILRVPKVTLGISEYKVESFDKSLPLSEISTWSKMDPFSAEIYVRLLSDCIKTLGEYDIALKGVDLYLQPDGSLIMINFSQVSYTKPNDSLLSISFNIPASVAGC
jgi:hypothetical protein